MPQHSLRVRRAGPGEDHYRGWASTKAAADLGIPVVLPDPGQVLSPWFGAVPTLGAQRWFRDWDMAEGGREVSRRRGETRRVTGGASSKGPAPSSGSGPAQDWSSSPPALAEKPLLALGIASTASLRPVAAQCLRYDGVDAVLTRELREELSASWGDVPSGAALVGTARNLVGVLHIRQ